MNEVKKKKQKAEDNQELIEAKASGSFGVFILLAIIIGLVILAFLGLFLASFINTP